MFIVLEGTVEITQRDALGRRQPVVEQGPGEFLAEVGQLSGRPALVDGHAEGAVEAILIPPEGLRALLVAEAELGERIIRALILRRVSLIQAGHGGPLIVGSPDHPDVARLSGFLRRNGQPHKTACPNADPPTRDLVDRQPRRRRRTCRWSSPPPATVLRNPTNAELARAHRHDRRGPPAPALRRRDRGRRAGGAGGGGLCGLRGADRDGARRARLRRPGGGEHAHRELPRLSDRHLRPGAGRARLRAGREVRRRDGQPGGGAAAGLPGAAGPYRLELDDGTTVSARTVVVASGARYRRPAIPRIDEFEGRGVWYWASPIEARLCAGDEVALVGGGNSAGQAAVYLSAHAAQVRMLVRGPGLAATMSRYLIERIAAAPEHRAEDGDGGHGARGRGRRAASRPSPGPAARTGASETRADPQPLPLRRRRAGDRVARPCGVALDRAGFVLTGAAVPGAAPGKPPLEASLPGVFAIGDVRAGSVKRVGGAIGEGAAVVAAIHAALAEVGVAV